MTVIAARHGDFGKVVILDLIRPVVPHVHLDYHMFFGLDGDACLFRVGHETHRLSAEYMIGVNPWQPHSYRLIDGCRPVRALVLYLDPFWLTSVFETIRLDWRQRIGCLAIDGQIAGKACELAAMMMLHASQASDARSFTHVLQDLCVEVIDHDYRTNESEDARQPIGFRVPADYRLRKSLAFMRDNISTRCSFDQVARQSGMSRPWFFNRFREQTGITPNMYWDSLRMDAAFKKLSRKDASICDVSFDLGFSSQSNFTRFFVNHFNASPSDFRIASTQH
jgi:AraC-like DNA-binding protein